MTNASKPTLIAVAEGASPLDVLAARHRAAWTRTQHGRQEWIEGTLELAAVLAEEKQHLPETQAFSRWLKQNNLAEISKDDRAALIGMATDLAVTREVLEKTDNAGWQYIWRTKLQERLRRSTKSRQTAKSKKTAAEDSAWPTYRVAEVEKMWREGLTMEQIGDELSTLKQQVTRNQIASVIRRFALTRDGAAADTQPQQTEPAPKPTAKVCLTREEVDPDFQGTDLEFRAIYGHVPQQTKTQIETHRRQEILAAWQAAVFDHAAATKTILNVEPVDLDTLREWAAKPGKMEKLRGWLQAIDAAHRKLEPYLKFIREKAGQ